MSLASGFPNALGVPLPPITIVDVGAMAEGPERYAGLLEAGLATSVGFEPDAAQFALLTAEARPRRSYLPYCLGQGCPGVMHVTRYPGCSSLYRPNAALIDLFTSFGCSGAGGNFHVLRTEPVETHRLDDIAECPQPDLLKLDVQGAELDVLQGAPRALSECLVVEAEVEFVPLYENQPLVSDVERFLRSHGFVLHKLIDIAGRAVRPFVVDNEPRAPMSQLLWADAVFIRDFTRPEALSDDQLLKLACLLHHPYRSHDMAHHFLAQYDRRRGTGTAEAFIRLLQAQHVESWFINVRA